MSQMIRFAAVGSRRRACLLAAALGFLCGCIQAVLPAVGELAGSLLLHLVLFATFTAGLSLGRCTLRAVVALSVYVMVLVLAVLLPFKFMDTRVQFDEQVVSVDQIRAVLELNGLSTRAASPLPTKDIRLTATRPSLSQLREALNQQASLDLLPVPACGNAVSISFLWGPRVSRPSLYLVALRRSRIDGQGEKETLVQAGGSNNRRTPASTGRRRFAPPHG